LENGNLFTPKISLNSKKILAGKYPTELVKLDNGKTPNLDFWEAIPPGVRNATLTSKDPKAKARSLAVRRLEEEEEARRKEEGEMKGKVDPNPGYTSPYTRELLAAGVPLKEVIKRSKGINKMRAKGKSGKGGKIVGKSGKSRSGMPIALKSPARGGKGKGRTASRSPVKSGMSKRNISRSPTKSGRLSRKLSKSPTKSKKSRTKSKRKFSKSPTKSYKSINNNGHSRSPTFRKDLITDAVAQLYTSEAQARFQRQHSLCPKKHSCTAKNHLNHEKSPKSSKNMPIRQKVCPKWAKSFQNTQESARHRRKRLWDDKANVTMLKLSERQKTKKKMNSLIYGNGKRAGRSRSRGKAKESFGMGTTGIGMEEPEVNVYDVGTSYMYDSFQKLGNGGLGEREERERKKMSATFANVFIQGEKAGKAFR
jgi:hypothetical protein